MEPLLPRWKLNQLLADFGVGFDGVDSGAGDVTVTDLTDDSRQVTPGSLWIARKGAGGVHGMTFARQACDAGCAAILTDQDAPIDSAEFPQGVPVLRTAVCDAALCSRLAARFFGHPARQLKVLAVTGTNGKTTVAWWMKHLLEEAGIRTGLIGTVVTDIGSGPVAASLTTPGPIELQRMLAEMVAQGCKAAACEFSSHALEQVRTAGVAVAVAVFTNLTGDHLDYHGSMQAYAAAKARLFEALGPDALAVVNRQSDFAARMVRDCQAKVVGCEVRLMSESPSPPGKGLGDEDMAGETPAPPGKRGVERTMDRETLAPAETFVARVGRADVLGCMVDWPVGDGARAIRLPVIGRHNVMNALQAWVAARSIAKQLGAPDFSPGTVEVLPAVPGRLEAVGVDWPDSVVDGAQQRDLPTVLADYAHTDDALKNVLQSLRGLLKEGQQLWVLFGCGGDRDRTKRPRMAEVAQMLADRLVITSDNPRTEDPAGIIQEILTGLPDDAAQRKPLHVEVDRALAIAWVVGQAGVNDVVLVAGKGHEDYQIVGSMRHHFDDREQVRDALRRRAGL
jgi:UDP-N-acetylmuramoyl-L-alanyl-D-glutamate--2,6-diaminopimelate ligase